ncbi:diacylglycerol/lipid kinase family protein [Fictibacillus fluitans]|uniref:Diacylglycerol kinase family lipid kinase n=1 Tax=Fictibacillus fluitans TaxID=3058422 RepID=A0ABT8I0K7_9BACL|nr:diacylglycerol kinase family protein [Fictibacillus sp. NE201]MDN4526559.1 diacylglycerol kinase family lipid kinase [Fictibacillus sp. NE201]
MKKECFFIINAKSNKARKAWDAVKEILAAEGVPYRAFFTNGKGDAKKLAETVQSIHGNQAQAIIAVGGDGTIHEVVNGLNNKDIPVGFLPCGSGNDITRGLGIRNKEHMDSFIKHRLSSEKSERKMDVGYLKSAGIGKFEKRFVSVAGIGFDGEVTRLTNISWYKDWLQRVGLGGFSYTISTLRLLFSYQPGDVTLKLDGRTYEFNSVWLIAAGNLPFYGGGMKICPSANPYDGKLEICIVHNLSPYQLLILFFTVFFGRHIKKKGVTMLTGTELSIVSKTPLTVQADGEVIGSTPLECRVLPSMLTIKV